jgi:hypothetical protein
MNIDNALKQQEDYCMTMKDSTAETTKQYFYVLFVLTMIQQVGSMFTSHVVSEHYALRLSLLFVRTNEFH